MRMFAFHSLTHVHGPSLISSVPAISFNIAYTRIQYMSISRQRTGKVRAYLYASLVVRPRIGELGAQALGCGTSARGARA